VAELSSRTCVIHQVLYSPVRNRVGTRSFSKNITKTSNYFAMQHTTQTIQTTQQQISKPNSLVSAHIPPTTTANMTPQIILQEPDQTAQPQPHSHRQWWESFREGISSRRNSNVSPVQQQCWNDFKHDISLQMTPILKRDPYGFTSTGPSREVTPSVEQCWEDFKHSVSLKAGTRLAKDQYGFISTTPTREHTPALVPPVKGFNSGNGSRST